MKGLFLIAVLLAFVPIQASADWRCPRGSKQVQQIYAGGMLMAVAGPTCVEKRSLKSKNIPAPPSCEAGSFAYYSNETWRCESQSAGAPSTLVPGGMTACGMIGQPPCGAGQSGQAAPEPGSSGAGSGSGLYGNSLNSPQYTYSQPPASSNTAPSNSSPLPACPSGATLTSSIKLDQVGATNVDPPVCIVSFDPAKEYPLPPTCQAPQIALFDWSIGYWKCV